MKYAELYYRMVDGKSTRCYNLMDWAVPNTISHDYLKDGTAIRVIDHPYCQKWLLKTDKISKVAFNDLSRPLQELILLSELP